TRPTHSPRSTLKSTLMSARTAPNVLVTSSRWTIWGPVTANPLAAILVAARAQSLHVGVDGCNRVLLRIHAASDAPCRDIAQCCFKVILGESQIRHYQIVG